MHAINTFYAPASNGVLLYIRVVPNSSRNQVVGVQANRLKIKLTAPALEGRANAALVKFLAEVLNCSPAAIQMTHGKAARYKTVHIAGITTAALLRALPATQRKV
ncbi:MAG: YggU family protein [Candidatus Kerfeldbacteria bacterium]|nr:YggU family protein [Candidatus Kerfeldbacteria bacterium]